MTRLATIEFGYGGRLYDFSCDGLELHRDDRVIVETEKGKGLGRVVAEPREVHEEQLPENLKRVLRKALPEDLEAARRNATREKDAFAFCLRKIAERNMQMKLVRVEYLFDGSKAIFYFTADGRVDFRDLVKDLAHQFHTRIEMRQIGVRDEAKMVGGIGICGRELCCSSFLREFDPVSVKMAKEQNLALNPSKISGQCGRLLCCLGYEYETYCTLKKCLPKCGKHVQCCGVSGEVVKMNILEGTVTVRTDEHRDVVLKGEDIKAEHIQDRPKQPRRDEPQKGKEQRPQGREQRSQSREQRPQGKEQRPPQKDPRRQDRKEKDKERERKERERE